MAIAGLPGFSAGGGMPISASSAATSSGGSVGSFNFKPKAGVPAWVLAAGALFALVLLARR